LNDDGAVIAGMVRVIACAPVEMPGMPSHPNINHYEQVDCPRCGQQMYLGPRSKIKHETEGIPIACMSCALIGVGVEVRVRNLEEL